MKYTQHRLTDTMLQRLSAACKDGGTYRGGNSMYALQRRGLVRIPTDSYHPAYRPLPTVATDAGHEALKLARQEGW